MAAANTLIRRRTIEEFYAPAEGLNDAERDHQDDDMNDDDLDGADEIQDEGK